MCCWVNESRSQHSMSLSISDILPQSHASQACAAQISLLLAGTSSCVSKKFYHGAIP